MLYRTGSTRRHTGTHSRGARKYYVEPARTIDTLVRTTWSTELYVEPVQSVDILVRIHVGRLVAEVAEAVDMLIHINVEHRRVRRTDLTRNNCEGRSNTAPVDGRIVQQFCYVEAAIQIVAAAFPQRIVRPVHCWCYGTNPSGHMPARTVDLANPFVYQDRCGCSTLLVS